MAFDGILDPKTSGGADAEAGLAARIRQTNALVHDFGNLMTVVLNASEALAEPTVEGSTGHDLAHVTRGAAERGAAERGAAERGAERVRRVMEPPPNARSASADCAQAINTTARRARLAASRSITVEVRLTDATLISAVDAAGLESALLNLCLNASHAMPSGGTIMLTAQAWSLADIEATTLGVTAGRYNVMSVADTGLGMSPESLTQATEPFFTTRRGRGGAGLGLAAVRDFAEAAGGRLVLTSREGRGTTARLYLPCA